MCLMCISNGEMLLPQAPEPAVCLPLVHQPTIPCARAPGLESARIASTHCEVPLLPVLNRVSRDPRSCAARSRGRATDKDQKGL